MRIPPKNEIRQPVAAETTQPSSTRAQGVSALGDAPADTPEQWGVDISALAERYGWQPESWQGKLLRAADAAGTADGKVSVAEVDAYLAEPDDLQFLTSSRLLEQRLAVKSTGGRQSVDSFESGWKRNLASRADLLGQQDGFVTSSELEAYYKRLTAGQASDSRWMPEQKSAVLGSKIAELTGEVDHLRVAGGTPKGKEMAKEYMRVASNDVTRAPDYVSYVISAADRAVQDDISRSGLRFRADPEQPSAPVEQEEYTEMNRRRPPEDTAPFDRGHMREAESSVDKESMRESFLTSNSSPQYAPVNQGAWRYLEEAVLQLTVASQGKATVFSGNLYLDAQGKPLPPEEISRRETKEGKSLGIPTHCYKAVLLEQPDGKKQAYAFIIPNRPDLSAKLADVTELFRQEQWRVNVDTVEQLTGYDFFSQLEAEEQARLESDATRGASFLDPTRDRLAFIFMGGEEPPQA